MRIHRRWQWRHDRIVELIQITAQSLSKRMRKSIDLCILIYFQKITALTQSHQEVRQTTSQPRRQQKLNRKILKAKEEAN